MRYLGISEAVPETIRRANSVHDLNAEDLRRQSPRFQGDNFAKNLELLDRVSEIAAERKITPGQLALARVLAQGRDVVPIPGTMRVRYLEENIGAVEVVLTSEDLARIEEAAPTRSTAGERYGDMSSVNL